MDFEKILYIAEFLGKNMTEDQADELFNYALNDLSRHEMKVMAEHLPGTKLYTLIRQYMAETQMH